jgi:hypothetical protein
MGVLTVFGMYVVAQPVVKKNIATTIILKIVFMAVKVYVLIISEIRKQKKRLRYLWFNGKI